MMIYDANGDTEQTLYTTQTVSNAKLKLDVMYGDDSGFAEAVQCEESHFDGTVATGEDTVWDQLSGMSGSMFCPSQAEVSPETLRLKVTCKACTDNEIENWNIVTYMVSTKVNMAQKSYPLFSFVESTGSFQLSIYKKYFHDVSLRFNQMVTNDKPMSFGGPGGAKTFNFFDTQYAE